MLGLFIIFIAFAYLLGSLSTGIVLAKLMGFADPRTEGSKNIGATNVLRVAGKQAAIVVLIGDILKGFVPIFLATSFGFRNMSLGFIGVAVILGHLYPVFFGFRGGKGVATAIGVWFGLSFALGLWLSTIWIAVAIFSRYASLASLVVAITSIVLGTFLTDNISYFIPLGIIALLLIWRHSENIERLKDGTESKIDF